jgi:hypothetical protein
MLRLHIRFKKTLALTVPQAQKFVAAALPLCSLTLEGQYKSSNTICSVIMLLISLTRKKPLAERDY